MTTIRLKEVKNKDFDLTVNNSEYPPVLTVTNVWRFQTRQRELWK
jgi:hypothetical protein